MPKGEDFVPYIPKCVIHELHDVYPEVVAETAVSLPLALAYLTGILPIKRYNSESALNNFKEHTMISPKRLAEYVGFTQEEVKNLCGKYQMDFHEEKVSVSSCKV